MSDKNKPEMKVVYAALKSVHMGGGNYRNVGDLIPEAGKWPHVDAEVRLGNVFPIFVSTLDEETQAALVDWEAEQEERQKAAIEAHEAKMKAKEEPDVEDSVDSGDSVSGDSDAGDDGSESERDFDGMTIAELKAFVDEPETSIAYAANDNHAAMVAHAKAAHALRSGEYESVTVEVLHGELDWREIAYAKTDRKDDLIGLLRTNDNEDDGGDTPSE